jgi:hypothetical protein
MTRPVKSPLAYTGVKAPNPPNVIVAQKDPSSTDKYDLGTMWINESTNNIFFLTSIVAGVPYWVSGGSDAMTGYVVDSSDITAYQTIQSAIDAAQTAGVDAVVYIRPGSTGTYTENLTLYDGIVLQGSGLETTITGAHTPPASGIVTMYDLTLTSPTDILTSAAAGSTQILLFNCLINCTNGYTFDLANWTGALTMVQCAEGSTANGVVNNQGGSAVTLWNCVAGAGTTSDMALSGCALTMYGSRLVCQATFSGATTISATMGCSFGGTLTTAGTTSGNINASTFSTGATAALSHGSAGQLNLSQVTVDSSANPAIAGAGAGGLMLADVEFLDGSNLAATLTLVATNEKRLTKILAGDDVYRTATFSGNGALIQAYGNDATATGAASNNALLGDLTVSSGNGLHTPYSVEGRIETLAGSNVLASIGVYGYSEQPDGSVIASTGAGVEGHLDLLETDAADLPQVYGFGVKGYLDAADTTATPAAGIFAGVGSIVEYNTPFNAVAYGMAVSRLDAGGGAGTAGQAAYGVVQGTGVAADWLYGLDLYNGAAGVAYTTADIRLFNQSTIAGTASDFALAAAAAIDFKITMGDAIGVNKVSFEDSGSNEVAAINSRGDISGRNINVTNTNIASFNVNPILQTKATTGGVPTGTTGDYNIMYCQDGVTMEQFILGAGQTIIAPRLADDGLLMSLDLSNSEGAEYYFGHTTGSRHTFTIGTSPAFFVEATFKVADCGVSDPLWLGFRILGAPNAAYTAYTDAGVIGLHNTTNPDTVIIGKTLNGPGWSYVNTTDAWTDGQTHTLRVNVSAAGVVTYLIDGVAPTVTQTLTFDTADVVIPFIHHLFAAAGSPAAIHIQSFACGLQ